MQQVSRSEVLYGRVLGVKYCTEGSRSATVHHVSRSKVLYDRVLGVKYCMAGF